MDLRSDDSLSVDVTGAERVAFGPGTEGVALLRAHAAGVDAVEVTFSYADDDLLRGLAEHQRRSRPWRRIIALAVVELVLFGLLAVLGGGVEFVLVGLVLVATMLGMPLLVRRTAVRTMRRDAAWRQSHQWTVSDDGLLVVRPSADSRLGWNGVQRVVETPDAFMFYPQTLQFMLLPKRCLTPEQIDRVRELAQAHTTIER